MYKKKRLCRKLSLSILTVFLLLLMVSITCAEDDITFHLPFDSSLKPQTAFGEQTFRSYGKMEYVEGVKGKALVVGGKSRCVYPADRNINLANGTLSMWVQPINWDSSEEKFYFFITLSNPQTTGHTRVLLYKVHNSEALTLLFQNLSKDNTVSLSKSMVTWQKKQWRHLVFTWDQNADLHLYIDGKLAAQQKCFAMPAEGWNLLVGIPWPGWGFLGDGKTAIDELTAYSRVLSDDEVRDLYEKTVQKSQATGFTSVSARREDNLATPGNDAFVLTSSFHNSKTFYHDNLIDEDNDSVWRAWDSDFPQWLELRWPNPRHINEIAFDEVAPTTITSYSVYAWQGGQWQLLKKSANRSSPESTRVGCRFNEVVTERLRLVLEAGEGRYTQLSGLEVFGPPQPIVTKLKPYWHAWYIWYPEPDRRHKANSPRYFRKSFTLDNLAAMSSAYILLRSNDYYKVYINGQEVASGSTKIRPISVKDYLRQGTNTVAIVSDLAKNPGNFGWGELLAELALNYRTHSTYVGTDKSWKCYDKFTAGWQNINFDDSNWRNSAPYVRPPEGPWGKIPYYATAYCESVILNNVSTLPAEAKPSDKVRIDISLTPLKQLEKDYVFVLELRGEEALSPRNNFRLASVVVEPETPTSRWPTNQPSTISAEVHLPDYSPNEVMPIYLRALDKKQGGLLNICDAEEKTIQKVGTIRIRHFDEKAHWGELLMSQILQKNNSPVLSFGQELSTPVSWMIHSPTYEKFHLYSKAANSIFWLCEYTKTDGLQETIQRVNRNLDVQIRHLLAINPKAWIFLSLELRPSHMWLKANPGERMITGSGALGPVSFASRKYHNLIDNRIKSVLAFVKVQPYAGRVIGYRPMSFGLADSGLGGGDENIFQTDRSKVVIGDYNPQAIKLFQDYLRKKYNNSVAALRTSWKDNSATFDTAKPVLAELTQAPADGGVFVDPTNGNKNYDYLEFLPKLIPWNYFRIYDLIKDVTDNKVLVGTHYGYCIEHLRGIHPPGPKGDNNFEIENMLDDRALDFYAGAMHYGCRLAGLPYQNMFCQGSIRLHKKLQMNDADYRTFIAGSVKHGRQRSIKESVAVLQRDRATMIIKGFGCWYSDISNSDGRSGIGWFTDTNILGTIEKMNDIYKTVINMPQKNTTEIAVFISGKTWRYHDVYGSQNIYNNLVRRVIYNELPRLGTPFDVYYMSDIKDDYVQKQYKMYVFINPYYMSEEEAQGVERLKRDGKTLFWFYAPGYVNRTTGLTAKNIANVTGIAVKKKTVAKEEMQYSITNTQHIVTQGVNPKEVFKTAGFGGQAQKMHPTAFGPVFYIDDKNAVTLGAYPDGRVAVAAKDMGDWKSVYCAVPYADRDLIRGAARYAGVHFYCDSDVIMDADNRLVMIHNGFDGLKNLTINLPEKHTVHDAISNQLIGRNIDIIQTQLDECQTKVFLLKAPK